MTHSLQLGDLTIFRMGLGANRIKNIPEAQYQIALAWLLKRSPSMLPIPGTLSLQHLMDNVAALSIELYECELK